MLDKLCIYIYLYIYSNNYILNVLTLNSYSEYEIQLKEDISIYARKWIGAGMIKFIYVIM